MPIVDTICETQAMIFSVTAHHLPDLPEPSGDAASFVYVR
jgi:hypothetical protein